MPKLTEDTYKLKALKFSALAIALVIIVEVTIGLVVNSLAILSDGLHALLDAMTSIMLFAATRAALKPPDEEHTYGHEKFESIGGLIGGIVLIGVALLVIYEAITKLIQGAGVNAGLELAGFVAIGYTFATDVVRVVIFRKAASSESTTVKAGFYHAIADLSSTLIAFFGFGLAIVGFSQGDSLASIVLGVLLSYLSVKLVRSNVIELSDTTSREMVQKIRKEILSNEGTFKCEKLKVRKVSSKMFIETTVQVSNHMSLEEAHNLASKLEANLTKAFGNVDATIHIEPSERETRMEQLVEKLATVDGVKEVHDVATVYASGKLYITLHAYVDPKLSVEEAHEIAEKIENKMHAGIKQLENVTVHVEPYGADVHMTEIDEKELAKIVKKVARNIERNLYVKNVVTYVAEGKRFINMDCCFTKQVSIRKAHEIASRIETEVKERFADAVVTVHMEPDYAGK
jgi:cation diffusion facilitator family transporter